MKQLNYNSIQKFGQAKIFLFFSAMMIYTVPN